jgi:hypothetical protein
MKSLQLKLLPFRNSASGRTPVGEYGIMFTNKLVRQWSYALQGRMRLLSFLDAEAVSTRNG